MSGPAAVERAMSADVAALEVGRWADDWAAVRAGAPVPRGLRRWAVGRYNGHRARGWYSAGGERVYLSAHRRLLSPPGATDKLALAGGDDRPAFSLSLSAGDRSGVELCAFRGECFAGCVGDAGNGGFGLVQAVRRARSRFVTREAGAALVLMVAELDEGVIEFGRVALRPNAYSDLRWERILPAWFWTRWGGAVAFYDYTKHPVSSRPAATIPASYSLTYSFSERSTARAVRDAVAIGRNVAVVVSTRGGKRRDGTKRPIPAEVLGLPTIDGDEHDRRYSDPRGVAVVLRRKKGTLSADSPFVVAVGQ